VFWGGIIQAIKKAYPNAKDAVLNSYDNDAICGTWEKLADAVYKGGSLALAPKGWQVVGSEKSRWLKPSVLIWILKTMPHLRLASRSLPLRQKTL